MRLLVLILFLAVLFAVDGKVTVTITLGSFTARGLRCDWFLPCDFKFSVCVDDILTSSGNRMFPCTYTSRSTSRLGAAPINLASKVTPIIIQMDAWKGVRLKVRVLDHDQYSEDDEIDFLSMTYLGPIGRRLDTVMVQKTRLSVVFVSACSAFYYGPSCATLCVPQNNDLNGHYFCEPIFGGKICLPGWMGSNCNESLSSAKDRVTELTSTIPPFITTQRALRTSEPNIELESPSTAVTNDMIDMSPENITEAPMPKQKEPLITGDLDYAVQKGFNSSNITQSAETKLQNATKANEFEYLNRTRSWLCGKVSLISRTESVTFADLNKISKIEESLKLDGNVSLTVSLDQHFQCNGSLVEVFQVDYCWNTLQTRSKLEHIIRNKFSDVFGYFFEFINKDFCFIATKDSTTEIMYCIWGSLSVIIIAVLVTVIIIYKRRKRIHTINSDAKFMFLFKRGPTNAQHLPKTGDDKLNIIPTKIIDN